MKRVWRAAWRGGRQGLRLGILLAAVSCSLPDGGASRPNLLILIADDMGWDDLGAYEHPTIRTPHLDRLAREGMRFEQAFLTASSCSPSRASIITGRYPHNTDAEQLHWPLPAEQTTFVEHLRRAGYWTAAAGKWHLGEEVKDRFDEVREADPGAFQLSPGNEEARFQVCGDAALQCGCDQWIPLLRERPRDRPFFLWLAALDPHRDYRENILSEPHLPAQVRVPPYLPDLPEVRRELALYYDEITRLDGFVGEVLQELDRQGVADNTLVLFLSDNGRPFPRDKTTLYHSGIKTPWIVRWPQQVAPGASCSELVSAVDIAPTFLELAGLEIPPTVQGRSFLLLLSQCREPIREYVFAERNWHDYEDRARAVRSVRYKYIRNDYPDLPNTPPADVVRSVTFQAMRRLRDQGDLSPAQQTPFQAPRPAEELYDTQTDPFELENLAGRPEYAEILQELRRVLQQWEESTLDHRPRLRTPDEFDRELGTPLPNRVRPRPSKREMRQGSR